jgi:hypothetical protein
MRKQLLWFLFLSGIAALASPAQETISESHIIDLRNIGYPRDDCKFSSARLEFLDSVRLLVSFPLHTCNGNGPTQERQAAVVDVSGQVVHTLNLQRGQLVHAGPNGHILSPAEKGLSILGADFSELQLLPWPKEIDTSRIPFWTKAGRNIYLTPSREGFAVEGSYPNYGIAYFEGNPVELISTSSPCSPLAGVTDGGFACFEQIPKNKLAVHLVNCGWNLEDSRFHDIEWAALPLRDRILFLTTKFKLYEFQRGRSARELADLHWLAPGLWNSGSDYTVTSRAAHRIVVSNSGCWFPLNDSTGIGYYQRILVLDYLSGAIIFKKKSSIGSNVTISPNGRLLAIREDNWVSLVVLP